MPHNLTETSNFDANVEVPDDGDALDAASVTVGFQPLANRTRYLRDRFPIDGNILWSGKLSNEPGSADLVAGEVDWLSMGGLSYPKDTPTTIPTSSLDPSSWYYVYMQILAGAIAFLYNKNPPDARLMFEFGDATHRYAGCFRTDGSGNIIPFRAHRGHYRYALSSGNSYKVLNGGSAISNTDVLCNVLVPPHSRLIDLRGTLNVTAGNAGILTLKTKGTAYAGTWSLISNASAEAVKTYETLEGFISDAAQVIQYAVIANCTADIEVLGFTEG